MNPLCGGGGGADPSIIPVVRKLLWKVESCAAGVNMTDLIVLRASGGPWAGHRITLHYTSPSGACRWASARLGQLVELEDIYAAEAE